MLLTIDYLVIGFYLVFMLVIGLVFRRYSKSIRDYFQAGGTMTWWMTGASALMGGSSLWTMTGAAGAMYDNGTLIGAIYLTNFVSVAFVALYSCYRFRQMRVMTYAEGIRRRFGGTTEQFYVWMQLPVSLITASFALNALGVFVSAAFGTSLLTTIVSVGGVVILVSLLGGAWSVIAGDFVQMLMSTLVILVAAIFTLRLPEIGGIGGLLAKLPPSHLHWTAGTDPSVVWVWVSAIALNSFLQFNNLAEGASRFLSVKDGRDARRAAWTMLAVMIPMSCLLFIPPLAARIVLPHLDTMFPGLRNPSEAAFAAMCIKVMPHGVLGLFVAGMFSMAMAGMDTGLNRNSGVFTRNVWQRFIRPNASQHELLFTGKTFTGIFGLIIVGLASWVANLKSFDLFTTGLAFNSLVSAPLIFPMVLGLFVKKAPVWCGWSTPLIGILTAAVIHYGLGALRIAELLQIPATISARESDYLLFGATMLSVCFASCAWFLGATWLTRLAPMPEEVKKLFDDMLTPIDPKREGIAPSDNHQFYIMSRLCLVYGSGILLFSLLPSDWKGRCVFLFCGGIICAVGALLHWNYRPGEKNRLA